VDALSVAIKALEDIRRIKVREHTFKEDFGYVGDFKDAVQICETALLEIEQIS
jgi:hypothetical protein